MGEKVKSNSNNSPICFCTTTDGKYFEPLLIAVNQVKKHHPDSEYVIYNWGLSSEQLIELSSFPNVRVIDWPLRLVDYQLNLGKKQLFQYLFKAFTLKSFIYNFLFNRKEVFRAQNLFDLYSFGMKMHNKLLCIKDLIKQTDSPIAIMDADAFLISPINQLLEQQFDVGVTLRRQSEISFKYNECAILNGGVVFLFGSQDKNLQFIDRWLSKLKKTRELYFEQTALTRMLHENKSDIFLATDYVQTVEIEKERFRISVLPCEIYNYNWIEEFDPQRDKDRVKILHFKSGRFNTPLFKKIAEELKL